MKAPDKIYLPAEEVEERKEWLTKPSPSGNDVCYIRKDVLIEVFLKRLIDRGFFKTIFIVVRIKDYADKKRRL